VTPPKLGWWWVATPVLLAPGLPRSVAELCRQCMAKRPVDRQLAYAESFWICTYVEETYGHDAILKMLDLMRQWMRKLGDGMDPSGLRIRN